MRIGPTGQRRLTAGHRQSRAPAHLPQGLRSPRRVFARWPGDPAGGAACPELAILVQERETPHSYVSGSFYSGISRILDHEFIAPWVPPEDNPARCAQENRRRALASEFPKGETEYGRLDANINHCRKIHRPSADGLCLICRYAPFSINNDIQIAFRLCHMRAGCKLEADTASRPPRMIEVHPALFEKV